MTFQAVIAYVAAFLLVISQQAVECCTDGSSCNNEDSLLNNFLKYGTIICSSIGILLLIISFVCLIILCRTANTSEGYDVNKGRKSTKETKTNVKTVKVVPSNGKPPSYERYPKRKAVSPPPKYEWPNTPTNGKITSNSYHELNEGSGKSASRKHGKEAVKNIELMNGSGKMAGKEAKSGSQENTVSGTKLNNADASKDTILAKGKPLENSNKDLSKDKPAKLFKYDGNKKNHVTNEAFQAPDYTSPYSQKVMLKDGKVGK